jgi:hypothetical protein
MDAGRVREVQASKVAVEGFRIEVSEELPRRDPDSTGPVDRATLARPSGTVNLTNPHLDFCRRSMLLARKSQTCE